MNENDSEVAHPGNGIKTLKTTALRPIWQFATDKYFCQTGMAVHNSDVWSQHSGASLARRSFSGYRCENSL
jgi:DNA polymerase III psi subunit